MTRESARNQSLANRRGEHRKHRPSRGCHPRCNHAARRTTSPSALTASFSTPNQYPGFRFRRRFRPMLACGCRLGSCLLFVADMRCLETGGRISYTPRTHGTRAKFPALGNVAGRSQTALVSDRFSLSDAAAWIMRRIGTIYAWKWAGGKGTDTQGIGTGEARRVVDASASSGPDRPAQSEAANLVAVHHSARCVHAHGPVTRIIRTR